MVADDVVKRVLLNSSNERDASFRAHPLKDAEHFLVWRRVLSPTVAE
jgi:hypothetical protein